MLIQKDHGLFPRITGKGDNAKRLADLLVRMRKEHVAGEASNAGSYATLSPSSTLEGLVIIDREADFVTPLLTQLTYEGLLDEVFGIENSLATVDSSIVGTAAPSGSSRAGTSQQTKTQKVKLDSTDKLFEQFRDNHFAVVGDLIGRVARRLQTDYESRHTAQSIADLREFVNRLPGYQSEHQNLKIHANMFEKIRDFAESDLFKIILEVQQNIVAGADASLQHDNIEQLIARDISISVVLRLICTESIISGGLKQKDLDNFKQLVLKAYGYQHLLTLSALEKMGFLQVRAATNVVGLPGGQTSGRTNYSAARKQLRLIMDFDEVDEQNPNDVAYVYSGYAPLSIRLVQCILQKKYLSVLLKGQQAANAVGSLGLGWKGFEDAAKSVQGKTFDEIQRGEEKTMRAKSILNSSHEKKTVIVFFLGGITYTEIAALRFIAKKEDSR
jgi:hypothetical protein